MIKIYVAFSSGKDSHASLIWASKKYGNDKVKAVFCDTGWETAITYAHAVDVCKMLDIELITLRSKKYSGMIDLATKKKRFPSTKARFCTEELKSKPMIDFILDVAQNHVIILQGIRKDESLSRSKMFEYCQFFKYYFNSIGIYKNGKSKYHTYRKKEVVDFVEKYMHDIERPVFNWTGNDVMTYILENGHKPNPLYYLGVKRVGCMPCIMCTKNEVKIMVEKLPEYAERLALSEEELNAKGQRSNFFGPGYIPAKYCKITYIRKRKIKNKKTGIVRISELITGIPTAREVFNYVTRFANQTELHDDPNKGRSCMSAYGICE